MSKSCGRMGKQKGKTSSSPPLGWERPGEGASSDDTRLDSKQSGRAIPVRIILASFLKMAYFYFAVFTRDMAGTNLMSKDKNEIDWSLTTFKGSRREQLRRWAQLPLEKILLAIEEMQEIAQMLGTAPAGGHGEPASGSRVQEPPAGYGTSGADRERDDDKTFGDKE